MRLSRRPTMFWRKQIGSTEEPGKRNVFVAKVTPVAAAAGGADALGYIDCGLWIREAPREPVGFRTVRNSCSGTRVSRRRNSEVENWNIRRTFFRQRYRDTLEA